MLAKSGRWTYLSVPDVPFDRSNSPRPVSAPKLFQRKSESLQLKRISNRSAAAVQSIVALNVSPQSSLLMRPEANSLRVNQLVRRNSRHLPRLFDHFGLAPRTRHLEARLLYTTV